MKTIAGLTLTLAGIIIGAATTITAILWWTTADVLREMRRR